MYSHDFRHRVCGMKDLGIVETYSVVGFFDFDFCCIFGDAKDLLPSQNIVLLSDRAHGLTGFHENISELHRLFSAP